MKYTNIKHKKDTLQICVLAYILLMGQSFSGAFAEELQLPKDLKVKVSEHFRFFGPGDDIDRQALGDPNNNPILVACLKGSTDESLRDLGIPDLQDRLERLERGNFIRKANGRYTLAFPTVLGEKKNQLQEYAEQIARKLVPLGEKIIADIGPHLAGRDEMLYHVLLSAILGEHLAWSTAWAEMTKQVKSGDTSFGRKAWLVYPPHPFRAAPNNYGSLSWHLRITWNHNTPSPDAIRSVISQYADQLTQAVEQNSAVASIEARNALGKYGLVDEAGKVRFYSIRRDSEAAKVYANLARQYGQQVMNHLDVAKVADMLDVSPGLALVITGCEIRCQLLQNLAEKGSLEVPRILAKPGTEASEACQLVSLTIIPSAKDPFLKTEISEEEKETIKRFNEIKKGMLAGERYFNLSTPIGGLLSYISAVVSKDVDTYRKSCAVKISGSIEFSQNWINQYKYMCIYRVQAWSRNPAEEDVHPIYVMAEGEKEFSDVEVFIYHQGGWRKLFNVGNSRTDWRKAVGWGKSLLK